MAARIQKSFAILLLGLSLGVNAFSAGPDPYAILGVQRGASEAELKAAFRQQALRFHPDRNPGNPAAEESFKRVSAAYELLQDPALRQAFDRGRLDPVRDLRWPAAWGSGAQPASAARPKPPPPPPPKAEPPKESARAILERWKQEWVSRAPTHTPLAASVAAWAAHPEAAGVTTADRQDWFRREIALSLTDPQRAAFANAPSAGAALETLFDQATHFPDRDLQLVRDLLPVLESEPNAALAHLGLAETLAGARFNGLADDLRPALWRLLRQWELQGVFAEDTPEGARAYSYLRKHARGPAASCAMNYSRLAF